VERARGSIRPFGAVEVTHGADFHQPLRWPGHYYDADTGLHYNRFREYDPRLGRYLQSDPQGISGGDNLYAYAWDDNPLRSVDVRGLACPGEGGDGAKGEDGVEGEGTTPKARGVDEAQPADVLTRAPGAHTLERHGGSVTNEQLEHRARTGVAPDGSSVTDRRTGETVLPPHATAFHSDEHALRADAALRESGALQRAIDGQGGAPRIRVPTTDVGFDAGRGFSPVERRLSPGAPPATQGPLEFHPAITSVRGYYERDQATGEYFPVTFFPEPTK